MAIMVQFFGNTYGYVEKRVLGDLTRSRQLLPPWGRAERLLRF